MNFWGRLKKPFFILAPMDGVTDTVFRQIVTSEGKPDVFFTEFLPVEAILSEASKKVLETFKYSEKERPIVAQIWGSNPESFLKVARIVVGLKFDGIDINMGCPQRNVIKVGACSALIKDPKLAQEIIHATIEGAKGLPVSVKTRIGLDSIDTENWSFKLLQTPISALTLHLRTVKEESCVPAHWEEIEKVINVRNQLKSKALIIGNGDVKSLKEAREKCQKYNIDGVMIGRGIFENPWVFNEKVDINKVTPKQKIELLVKHLELFRNTYGDGKNFASMKKFVKCYVNGFDGASRDREKLMETNTLDTLISESRKI